VAEGRAAAGLAAHDAVAEAGEPGVDAEDDHGWGFWNAARMPSHRLALAMVDFDAEGLLEGLEGRAREERAELLRQLHDQGASLEELRDAVQRGRLLLLPAERLVGGEATYTAQEAADRAGIDVDFLIALQRVLGLPNFDRTARVFRDSDVEAARMARAYEDAGLPREAILETTRVLGRGLSQAADVMRSVVLRLVLRPGASEAEIATSYARATEALAPMLGPLLEQLLRIHLRQAVSAEIVSAAEREAGELPGAREVAVGFLDLVGFTRLGETVPPDELGRVAERLESLAGESVSAPVRLVKTIGDAVMLVSPEPKALIDTSLDIVAAADAEGEDFPQVRGGLAFGSALARAGDWFGRPVNLASRVTNIARPGSVLTTQELHEAVGEDGLRWSFAGSRSLKGIPGSVPLYRVRRAEPDDEPEPDDRRRRRKR
jgi:adenylate cyclase